MGMRERKTAKNSGRNRNAQESCGRGVLAEFIAIDAYARRFPPALLRFAVVAMHWHTVSSKTER